MKIKNILIGIIALVAITLSSCGEKHEEQTKQLSADNVTFSGVNGDLFELNGDSVKVILKLINDDEWGITVVSSFKNTQTWNQLNLNTDKYSEEYDTYYEQGISYGVEVWLLDENGVELKELNEHNLREGFSDLLKKVDETGVVNSNLSISSFYSGSYSDMKAIFDKVKGVEISGIEITSSSTTTKSTSSSSSSSRSYDDDDDLEELNDALDKSAKMIDAYGDMVKAIDDLDD